MSRHKPRTDLVAYVINADNNRGDELAHEMKALRASEPDLGIVGIIEATGNRIDNLPGMGHFVGKGPSRGNIAGYVSKRLLGRKKIRPRWHDMKRTWPRTEGPGIHPPRSYASANLGRVQVVVAHVPPDAPGAGPARDEIVDSLVGLLAPWTRTRWRLLRLAQRRLRRNRPRLLFIDANGMKAELCQRAELKSLGDGPDFLMFGGDVKAVKSDYLDTFRPIDGKPVPFRGDHKRVLRVVVSIPTKYLPKGKP